jgi:hypothetical protein
LLNQDSDCRRPISSARMNRKLLDGERLNMAAWRVRFAAA